MRTERTTGSVVFQATGGREVVARFDGGTLTSDGEALRLREVERATGIVRPFPACFIDHPDPRRVEHPLATLVAPCVFGLALGHEDLKDHDALRADPLLAVVAGSADPAGQQRRRARDASTALAGTSTRNRLELTGPTAASYECYKNVTGEPDAVDRLLVQAHASSLAEITLDLDATDDPFHGQQEGRFFQDVYGYDSYLPPYIVSGDHLLCARLRGGGVDASVGATDEVDRLVAQLRTVWPHVRITVRADSGFCRDDLLTWCETHDVDYVIGLARNRRLVDAFGELPNEVTATCVTTDAPTRAFAGLPYRARRHGESDRGAAADVLRGSHECGDPPRESAAPDVFRHRVRAPRGAPSPRSRRHAPRDRAVPDDSADVSQARRAAAHHRAQGLGLLCDRLSPRGALRHRARAAAATMT